MLQIVAKMSARLGAALGEVPDINSADRSHQHHTRVRRREEERGTHAVCAVCCMLYAVCCMLYAVCCVVYCVVLHG